MSLELLQYIETSFAPQLEIEQDERRFIGIRMVGEMLHRCEASVRDVQPASISGLRQRLSKQFALAWAIIDKQDGRGHGAASSEFVKKEQGSCQKRWNRLFAKKSVESFETCESVVGEQHLAMLGGVEEFQRRGEKIQKKKRPSVGPICCAGPYSLLPLLLCGALCAIHLGNLIRPSTVNSYHMVPTCPDVSS
jgi:hypothetical protein